MSASMRRTSVSGKQCLELLLDLLGADADDASAMPPHWTDTQVDSGLGVAAVMAHQPSVGGVVGQRAPSIVGTPGPVRIPRTETMRLLPRRFRNRMLCSPRSRFAGQLRGAAPH